MHVCCLAEASPVVCFGGHEHCGHSPTKDIREKANSQAHDQHLLCGAETLRSTLWVCQAQFQLKVGSALDIYESNEYTVSHGGVRLNAIVGDKAPDPCIRCLT
jgi:hypothetical protein